MTSSRNPPPDVAWFDELSLLTDHLPAYVGYVDRDKVYRYVNARYAEAIGRDRAVLVGRPVREVLGDRAAEYARPYMDRALAGRATQFKARYTFEDGTRRWLDIHYVPDRRDGEVLGFYSMCLDVDESEAAAQATAEREALLRSFIENAPIGIVVYSLDFEIKLANPAIEAFLGVEPGSLVGKRPVEFTHPDDRAQETDFHRRITAGELNSYRVRKRYRRRNGETVWGDLTVSRGLPDTGLLFGMVRDVTQEVEEDLGRQRLLTAIEQSDDSVVITDTEATIQYVNEAFTRITGYEYDEAVGQNPRLLQSGEHDADFYAAMWRALAAGEPWSGRIVNRRKDGERFVEAATISPVRDARGDVVNYVGVKRDITRELEREQDLRHAQKMEAIGVLAGGVAHDFNNALYVISGNVELALSMTSPDSEEAACLRQALTGCARARDLVQRILACSRREEHNVEPVDLRALVHEVAALLAATLPATVTLVVDVADDCPPVLADAGELHQVLMNLGTNAYQALPAQKGRLTMSAHGVNRGGEPFVRLRVRDDGVGMSPEVKQRCLDPYYTTKATGEGTGMGLAIVHGIVSSLQGSVHVDSAPGHGTTVAVLLPAHAGGAPTRTAVVASRPAPRASRASTIMVVDDEPGLLDLVSAALRQWGYRPRAFGDVDEALAAFHADPDGFDLVLTDQTMPGRTGAELAGEMLTARPDLPVILCSGYSATFDVEDARRLGVREFLAKPLTLDVLAAAIARALGSPSR